MSAKPETGEAFSVSFEDELKGLIQFIGQELSHEQLIASAVSASPMATQVFESRVANFSKVYDLLKQMLESEAVPFLENLNGTISCCPGCRH